MIFKQCLFNQAKQCSNCKCWFTTQKSLKHHIRHCRRSNSEETLNVLGISAPNPLLSNFTPGVETNEFNKSNHKNRTSMNMMTTNK